MRQAPEPSRACCRAVADCPAAPAAAPFLEVSPRPARPPCHESRAVRSRLAAPQERAGNAKPVDSRIFWLSLFLAPLLWLLLGVAALLSFSLDWLVLCSFALALTGTNTYGYYKCSAAARQRLQQALADSAIKAAVGGGGGSAFGTALISSMFGSSGAQPASGGAAAAAAPAATAARGSPAPGQAVTSKPGKAFEGDATGLGDDDAGGFVHSSEGGDGVPSRNPFDDDVAV